MAITIEQEQRKCFCDNCYKRQLVSENLDFKNLRVGEVETILCPACLTLLQRVINYHFHKDTPRL